MTDFDYKKYSLENLSKWAEDSLTAAEATPQEIYNTIHKVVEENYYYHKHHASRAYELMELLNGSNHLVCDKDDKSPECKKAWNDFWGDVDEREYNIREAEYYNKRAELDAKPNKWILPVELDGLTGDCYIQLPDDLLEVANLKEGDQVEWISQGNGSYLLKKVNVHS
jgi:hypothetical protein